MSRYPARVKREAVRRYETGFSCRAVAERMGLEGLPSPHYVTVLRWVKEEGKGRIARGRRIPLSGEIVRALYESGMHIREIAQRFDVGKTTTYKRLHEAGAKMRPSRIKYGHLLTESRLRVLYLEQNSQAQDIAAKFGCDVGTAYNWLRRNGVPLKRVRRT